MCGGPCPPKADTHFIENAEYRASARKKLSLSWMGFEPTTYDRYVVSVSAGILPQNTGDCLLMYAAVSAGTLSLSIGSCLCVIIGFEY